MVPPAPPTLFPHIRYTLCQVPWPATPQHSPAPHTARTRTQGPLFLALLPSPTHRGTACHARPPRGVQHWLHLPHLLHVHGQGGATRPDSQPSRDGGGPPAPTHRNKSKPRRQAQKTKTKNNLQKSKIPTNHKGKEGQTPLGPTPTAPRPSVLTPRPPQVPAPTIMHHHCMHMPGQPHLHRPPTHPPPTPHQTHFPPIFTCFRTHTTNHATPPRQPISARPHPHPIPHVPTPHHNYRHACPTCTTPPHPAPPATPSFPPT